MTREAKLGLLIGLAFIVLFGVILSARLATVSGHATMPVGQSQDHLTKYKAIHTNVDPFGGNDSPASPAPPGGDSRLVADARDAVAPPAEEAMPAPEHLVPAETPPPQPADRGLVAFAPVVVETPTRGEQQDLQPAPLELPADRPAADAPAPQPTDAACKVYIVKPGDTLTKISRHFFGKDGERLTGKIYEANKATLKDPHRLVIGQKLVIPGVPAEAPPTGAPKTGAPRTDPPRRDAPSDTLRDTAYADARLGGAPPLRIPSFRKDAPAGALGANGREDRGTLFRDTVNAPVRDVTLQDLEREYGARSDLVEHPVKPVGMYTVQSGDTFYRIASKLYGDGPKYSRLLALKNQHLVSDPSKLKVGQRIVLLDGVNATVPDSAVASR
ncbi:MAG: LysM peptidoglycan-binding domain-containing protein [Planctomycetota bacterium]|nr:LysM peptidoglycan-binding domain-containing protein [Planctomycetota bacterium]